MANNNAQRAGMRVQGRISHLKAMAFPKPEISCGFRARIHRAQQIVDVDTTCFTWRQEQVVSEDIVRAGLESILRMMTNCSPYWLMRVLFFEDDDITRAVDGQGEHPTRYSGIVDPRIPFHGSSN